MSLSVQKVECDVCEVLELRKCCSCGLGCVEYLFVCLIMCVDCVCVSYVVF